MMVDQLLWIDALAKFALGALLVLVPGPVAVLLGLPREKRFFYARLLGAVLFGLALALVVEGAEGAGRGLGLKGAFVVNLSAAAVLVMLLMFGVRGLALRGRLMLWGGALFLLLLAVIEWLYA